MATLAQLRQCILCIFFVFLGLPHHVAAAICMYIMYSYSIYIHTAYVFYAYLSLKSADNQPHIIFVLKFKKRHLIWQ